MEELSVRKKIVFYDIYRLDVEPGIGHSIVSPDDEHAFAIEGDFKDIQFIWNESVLGIQQKEGANGAIVPQSGYIKARIIAPTDPENKGITITPRR
jgi:hypothetical protein